MVACAHRWWGSGQVQVFTPVTNGPSRGATCRRARRGADAGAGHGGQGGDGKAVQALVRHARVAAAAAQVGDRGGEGQEYQRQVGSRVDCERPSTSGQEKEAAECGRALGRDESVVRVRVGY